MESRSSESRSSYKPSRSSHNDSSESRSIYQTSNRGYSDLSESRSIYETSNRGYSDSSESRDESRSTYQTNNRGYNDSSESRESVSSKESKVRYTSDYEYRDCSEKVPSYAISNTDDSVYITYRGERKVIKKVDVEVFKAKLVYPEDYETLLGILEQTTPNVIHPTPEITEELQKREIMITELRQRVIAKKTCESLVIDNEEINKTLGLHK